MEKKSVMFFCLDLCFVLSCFYVVLEMQIRDLEKKKAMLWNRCKKIWKIVNLVQLSIHVHTFPKASYPIQSLSQADSNTKLNTVELVKLI